MLLVDFALKAGAMLQVLGVWLTIRDLVAYSDRKSGQIPASRLARCLLLLPTGRSIVVTPKTARIRLRGGSVKLTVGQKVIDQGDLQARVANLEQSVRSHEDILATTHQRLDVLGEAIASIEAQNKERDEDNKRMIEAAQGATAADTARMNLRGGGLILVGLLITFLATPSDGLVAFIVWALALVVAARVLSLERNDATD